MSNPNSRPDRHKITLKELDHIQAILGRFDTFFFLMKQLCATAVFVTFIQYVKCPKFCILMALGIPIFFWFSELTFKIAHWSGYILRVKCIQNSINSGYMPALRKLYLIKEKRDSKNLYKRFRQSVNWFDCIYYIMIVLFIIGFWLLER